MPRIIFVLIFARTSRGIRLGNCVIAVNPTLNFLPSRAIVLKILGPFSRTSFPRTLGASSRTILTIGRDLSSVSG